MSVVKTIKSGLAMFLIISAPGEAFEVSEEAIDRLTPVLEKSGAQIHYFPGPQGMIGIGLNFKNGKRMVVYATESGKTLFSGVAVDVESGVNLVSADIQKLPAPDYESVVKSLSGEGTQVRKLGVGNPESTNRYFIFVDPTCGFCHETFRTFQTLIDEGQDLRVEYIPVGILGPAAENLAKAIIGGDEQEGLTALSKLAYGKRYQVVDAEVALGEKPHAANMAVFRELGMQGVPAIVSDVGGRQLVRSGLVEQATIRQELRLGAVRKMVKAEE